MTDNKRKRGRPDRQKVAGKERYEVSYLAKKFGVSMKRVRAAIARVGHSRRKVEAELKRAEA